MCFDSKATVDNTVQQGMLDEAKQARLAEEARQQRIRDGMATIDSSFAPFDNNFFQGIRDNYMAYQQPQLDNQFKNASDGLTFALARAGTLNSSIAGDKQARLTSRYDNGLASILSQAQQSADATKARIGAEKSGLVSMLNATGDASRIGNEATARTQMFFNPVPTYNPIGDIFGGVATGVGQYLNTQKNQRIYDTYFGGGNGGSSSRVIGG